MLHYDCQSPFLGRFAVRFRFPIPYISKETIGSLEFPSYPFRHMPRSQTPVVSCLLSFQT